MTKIAIVGDFDDSRLSHHATNDALQHAHSILPFDFETRWVSTAQLENSNKLHDLDVYDGIWGSAGDPDSRLGLIRAIEFARSKNIPYLGT